MFANAARSALALGSTVLVAVLAGCSQAPPPDASSSGLHIVGVAEIDKQGARVWRPNSGAPADPRGDGQAVCPVLTIAMAAALSGPDAALGMNVRDGVALAVDQHNAHNPKCQVRFKPFDTEGDPEKAVDIAPRIIDDPTVIGLIGPGNSG